MAIKFIMTSADLHPTVVGRFDTEAKALSRAKHPYIVPILEVGDDDRPRPGGTIDETHRRRRARNRH